MLECIITQECGGNNSHSSVGAFMANIPQSFGKYRILEEIARGSFGRVYRGEDTSRHNHPVAIKVMHAAHLASPQERSTFLQEAQLLTMLRHPHIVPVLDVGIEEELPYLVMEYAANGSLHQRLQSLAPRPLPLQDALTMRSVRLARRCTMRTSRM